jgi:hypothetical protein
MEDSMVIKMDRSKVDDSLEQDFSICILVGGASSSPAKVHACMDARGWGDEPWNKWFLITDPRVLSDEEKNQWFGRDSKHDYVFLGRTSKGITSSGQAKRDLLVGGECDYITFIEKFAEADQE